MLNLKPRTHSARTAVHHSWKSLKRKANKWEVRKIKEEWCDGWSWYDVWCWYENGIKVFPLKMRWRREQRGWHYKGYKPDTLVSLPEENAPSLDLQLIEMKVRDNFTRMFSQRSHELLLQPNQVIQTIH